MSCAARRETGHPLSTLWFEQLRVELGPGAVVSALDDDVVGAGKVEVESGVEVEGADEEGGVGVGELDDLPPPHEESAAVIAEASRTAPRRRLTGTGRMLTIRRSDAGLLFASGLFWWRAYERPGEPGERRGQSPYSLVDELVEITPGAVACETVPAS